MRTKQTWLSWARVVSKGGTPSNLTPGILGMLTGQDTRAMHAFVACLELYACGDENGQRGALEAVRALLPAMQRSAHFIARELIPFVLDWSDRERIWELIDPR